MKVRSNNIPWLGWFPCGLQPSHNQLPRKGLFLFVQVFLWAAHIGHRQVCIFRSSRSPEYQRPLLQMGTKENSSACCWDYLYRSECFHIRQTHMEQPILTVCGWKKQSTSPRGPAGAFSSVRVCFCVFTRYVGQLLLAGVGVLRLPTPLTWVFPSCKRKLSSRLWSAWQHNKTRKEKSVWTDKCRWESVLAPLPSSLDFLF